MKISTPKAPLLKLSEAARRLAGHRPLPAGLKRSLLPLIPIIGNSAKPLSVEGLSEVLSLASTEYLQLVVGGWLTQDATLRNRDLAILRHYVAVEAVPGRQFDSDLTASDISVELQKLAAFARSTGQVPLMESQG